MKCNRLKDAYIGELGSDAIPPTEQPKVLPIDPYTGEVVKPQGSETVVNLSDSPSEMHTVEGKKVVLEPPEVSAVRHPKDDAMPGEANLVTSQIVGTELHYPQLDLDCPVKLIPSTSNSHLYINKVLTSEQYEKVLKVLSEVGIIQEGYYNGFKRRGYTCFRLPGLSKGGNDNLRFSGHPK